MEWLEVKQVAVILSLREKTVRRLIKTGRLQAKDFKTTSKRPTWRVHTQWLEKFKESIPHEENT